MSLFAKGLLADVLEPPEARAHLTLTFFRSSRMLLGMRLQHVVGDLEQLRDSVPGVVAAVGASWREQRL